MDSGGNGAILNVGESGGPVARQEGRETGSWRRQRRGIDVQNYGKFKKRARHNLRSALCTEYVSCTLYIISALITMPRVTVIMNRASCFLYLSVSGE